MAEGRDVSPTYTAKSANPWTEIFRCFQVAIDPAKLLAAALGILSVSIGWFLLSIIFNKSQPANNIDEYTQALARQYEAKSPEEIKALAQKKFDQDMAEWELLNSLAGEGGRLRTMPWAEYRGPNPYLFVTTLIGGSSVERQDVVSQFMSSTVPVLIEPLAKLMVPVVKIVDPHASIRTRFYLVFCVLWSLACWAFFGGVITRIAAVQLTGKDRVTLKQAISFVSSRYLSYLFSPLVPLGIVAAVVFCLICFGFVALLPVVGDILLYGFGLPLIIAAGLVMAFLLVGLVGYPLMYTTLSVEGSDTFDAFSRSYNYVYLAPWQYISYSLISILYGAAVTFFVVFICSLTVYLGKWGVSRAPLSEWANRQPDFLFVLTPESFGWQQLFLKGSPLELKEKDVELAGRKIRSYSYANESTAKTYFSTFTWYNWIGAGMISFWLVTAFLLMLGFSYSFYWSAATMIYLLMRKKVDDVDLDEIYLEQEMEAPFAPTAPPPPSESKPGASSLPMVPPSPPVAPAPTPAPATVPFTPPVSATPPASSTPPATENGKTDDEKKS